MKPLLLLKKCRLLSAVFLVAVLCILYGCGTKSSVPENSYEEEKTYSLSVLETTDIHGYIADISTGNPDTYEYRLAYIAQVIENLRAEGDLLLLDGGDCYQGNVLSNSLDGQPIKAYYGIMDYDAVALGNHEFDWGVTTVLTGNGEIGSYDLSEDYSGYCDTPVLCWDIYEKETGEKVDFTQDYVIVEKTAKAEDGSERNVKIAIFGYIQDYSSAISEDLFAPYEIHESDIEDLEAKAEELESSGAADASVILCHTGPEAMDQLMPESTVIDLVVCGHTHVMDEGVLSNGVPYIIGGSYARSYAACVLQFTGNQVTADQTSYTNITENKEQLWDSSDNNLLQSDVLDISHAALEKLSTENPNALQPIGIIETSISKAYNDDQTCENIVTYWVAENFAKLTGADAGLALASGVRAGIDIPAGSKSRAVTGADIYTMLPFDNTMCVFEVTFEDLVEIEKESYIHERVGGFLISDVSITFGTDQSVKKLYFKDQLIYDEEQGGFVVDPSRTITVAADSYIATWDFLKDKTVVKTIDQKESDLLFDYLDTNYGPDKVIPVNTEQHVFVK